MNKTLHLAAIICLSFAFISSQTLLAADSSATDSTPIPAQLLSAKKIFVANGGEDPVLGYKPGHAYSQLYSRLKAWGQYDLVSAPSEADVVFQIEIFSSLNVAELRLSMLDPKTHTVLWVITEWMGGSKLDKFFNKAMDQLLADTKTLLTPPNQASAK